MKILTGMLFLVLACLATGEARAQDVKDLTREGNDFYRKKSDFSQADSLYRLAVGKDSAFYPAQFNAANAAYLLGRRDESKKGWESVVKNPLAEDALGDANYNLGNASMDEKDYAKAADYYKNTLRKSPKDEQARYNLALAQKLLKEQQNQNDQNKDNKDQNKDNPDNKENEQDKNNQDQDNKDQNKDNPDNKENPDDQNKDNNKDNKNAEGQAGISQDDMERLLDALAREEQKTQQKADARKEKAPARPSAKDW